jgi:phosphoribosyl 1,2-cyclic phosphodiesterase
MRRQPVKEAIFLFTHVHWDHIQGFPFFTPGFVKENRFVLFGPKLASTPGFVGSILEKALRGQQEDLNFPVQLQDMPAEMSFRDLQTREVLEYSNGTGGKLVIRNAPLNHPGGCYGYRIEEHAMDGTSKVFAFCTDTEHLGILNGNVQELARAADLFGYDCQYTTEEYEGIGSFERKGWGHSTWEWGLKEAQAAGARHLLMLHHDPLHDDAMVASMEEAARCAGKKIGIQVTAAAQFSTLEL